MKSGFDYVIVGAGSAGCVLAARLSQDPAAQVCLIEAGPRDRHPLLHIPIGYVKLPGGPPGWGFVTESQPHADGRKLDYPQARVMGGGSSINAQVFIRGNPADYDRWAAEGAEGWDFASVRPYFLRSEGNADLADAWHGQDGPLGVASQRYPNPLSHAFVRACREFGMPANPDFNGAEQVGAGLYQTTSQSGRRCSTAVGYLRPALRRPNLTVLANTQVLRLDITGARVRGVTCQTGGGATRFIAAAQEVILTAGAIGSPRLLMLSGIGPADHLRRHGIAVMGDLPGVGRNLQDHYAIDLVAELREDESLNRYRRPWLALGAGLRYALFRTGPVTSNVVEAGAFWHSGQAEAPPDLQFHFLAGAATGLWPRVPSVAKGRAGITINSYHLQPRSRGRVRLRSGDPADQPLVDPNFLADPEDLRISIEGLRISHALLSQSALAGRITRIQAQDLDREAGLAAYMRRYGRSSYHPVGTCRMGQDRLAVTAPDLRVHGLAGLRICDSSVMPSLVSGNTNAPTVMIAERASDLIRSPA